MANFCSNCGAPLNGGKFCSECGTPIGNIAQVSEASAIDFERGYSIYGKNKLGFSSWISTQYKIPLSQAKQLCEQFLVTKQGEKAPNLFKRAANQMSDMANNQQSLPPVTKRGQAKQRIAENKAKGVACCPKCGSTSLTANKKGFGVGKAVVGAALTGGIGLVAGNIGAKKVRITCLNCGHQFWAGK